MRFRVHFRYWGTSINTLTVDIRYLILVPVYFSIHGNTLVPKSTTKKQESANILLRVHTKKVSTKNA